MENLNSNFIDSKTGYSIRTQHDFIKIFLGLPIVGPLLSPLLLPLAEGLGNIVGSFFGELGDTYYYVPLIEALPDQISKIMYELIGVAFGIPRTLLKPFFPLLLPLAVFLGFVLLIPATIVSIVFGTLADVLGAFVPTGPL